MGRVGRLGARITLFVATTVVLSLLLGWLVEVAPWAVWVLGALSFVLLARTMLRVVRDPRPLVATAVVLLPLLLGWGAAAAVEAVVAQQASTGGGAPVAAVDATGSGDAATPGATAVDDEAEQVDDGGMVAVDPPGTIVGDDLRAGSVVGLEVADDGGTPVLTVTTDGGRPGQLWLFSVAEAGTPVVLAHDGAWQQVDGPEGTTVEVRAEDGAGGVTLALPGAGGTAWAVVDDSGVRVPDTAHAVAPGGSAPDVTGALAERLAGDLAAVERAVPQLDELTRDLVLSLVARQVRPGTFVLRRSLPDQPEAGTADAAFAVLWPRFSQRIVAADSGLFVTREALVTCTDGTCEEIVTTLPVPAAAAIAAAPDETQLAELPLDTDPTGQAVRCVEVTAVPDGGPQTGTYCWRADGLPTLLVRPQIGDRLELVSVSPDVDPADLEVQR